MAEAPLPNGSGVPGRSRNSRGGGNDKKNGKDGGKKAYIPSYVQEGEKCVVCGDNSTGTHYRAMTCEGCKGFFRRTIQKAKGREPDLHCKKDGRCEINMQTRNICQRCRYQKCLAMKMDPSSVLSDKDRIHLKDLIKNNKEERLKKAAATLDETEMAVLRQIGQSFKSLHTFMLSLYKFDVPYSNDQERRDAPSTSKQQDEEERQEMSPSVLHAVEFLRRVPGIERISRTDMLVLLHNNLLDVMALRLAELFDRDTQELRFSDFRLREQDCTREGYSRIYEFARHYSQYVTADGIILGCLCAIRFLSTDNNVNIKDKEYVNVLHNKLLELLAKYMKKEKLVEVHPFYTGLTPFENIRLCYSTLLSRMAMMEKYPDTVLDPPGARVGGHFNLVIIKSNREDEPPTVYYTVATAAKKKEDVKNANTSKEDGDHDAEVEMYSVTPEHRSDNFTLDHSAGPSGVTYQPNGSANGLSSSREHSARAQPRAAFSGCPQAEETAGATDVLECLPRHWRRLDTTTTFINGTGPSSHAMLQGNGQSSFRGPVSSPLFSGDSHMPNESFDQTPPPFSIIEAARRLQQRRSPGPSSSASYRARHHRSHNPSPPLQRVQVVPPCSVTRAELAHPYARPYPQSHRDLETTATALDLSRQELSEVERLKKKNADLMAFLKLLCMESFEQQQSDVPVRELVRRRLIAAGIRSISDEDIVANLPVQPPPEGPSLPAPSPLDLLYHPAISQALSTPFTYSNIDSVPRLHHHTRPTSSGFNSQSSNSSPASQHRQTPESPFPSSYNHGTDLAFRPLHIDDTSTYRLPNPHCQTEAGSYSLMQRPRHSREGSSSPSPSHRYHYPSPYEYHSPSSPEHNGHSVSENARTISFSGCERSSTGYSDHHEAQAQAAAGGLPTSVDQARASGRSLGARPRSEMVLKKKWIREFNEES